MRKIYAYLFIPALLLGLAACNKVAGPEVAEGQEIVLKIGNTFDAQVTATKGDRITSVPGSLYVGRSTGAAGSETNIQAPASKTVSAGSISTGFYQTATPTNFNWYVANQSFTIAAAGGTMTIENNTTDVIVKRVTSNSTSVAVQLEHVFACLKTLTANGTDGYSISNVSWKIKPSAANCGTAGTYNINTGAWSSTTAIPAAGSAVTSDSYNFYIPGEYVIECTYTATKGDYNETLTKSATVTLQRAKYNNITGTFGGNATPISLTLSVEDWGTNNINGTFS